MNKEFLDVLEKALFALAIVSGSSWKLVDIFKPLFNKIVAEDIRGMAKAIAAGVIGWALAWGFGVQALNALGYNIHPALDAVLAGLLASGGAALFNILYDILKVLKEFVGAKTMKSYAEVDKIDADTNKDPVG
jgi:Na+/serine symporter